MKLSEIKLTPGHPPQGSKPGMLVQTSEGLTVLGDWAAHPNFLFDSTGNMGCGCCSENRRITAWAWLPGFPMEEE